jgi:hypothetical protein
MVMINYTFNRDHRRPNPIAEVSNFYQKSFALALLNWEINRQEERLKSLKSLPTLKNN